ncbi:MAG: inositol monophosphatase family protein, partial [Pseudomonadota bacterium]|nr:inositol monophosphatase family protein [Pseudomonadota bacterium]
LSGKCRFRVFGADCYAYGLLASGFTDLVVEAQLQPYDYLALAPVVEGAGGVITDWSGNSLDLHSGDRALAAANPALHAAALEILMAEAERQ